MLRRHIVDRPTDALADTPAVLVNGARQTGKSTLVQAQACSPFLLASEIVANCLWTC
jgi:predicted AAA+ superfamily ATPase